MSCNLSGSFTIKKIHGKQMLAPNEYTIIIPVFGVRDAWSALKIADTKLKEIGKDSVINPTANSVNKDDEKIFFCHFSFISNLSKEGLNKLFPWNVYKISSGE